MDGNRVDPEPRERDHEHRAWGRTESPMMTAPTGSDSRRPTPRADRGGGGGAKQPLGRGTEGSSRATATTGTGNGGLRFRRRRARRRPEGSAWSPTQRLRERASSGTSPTAWKEPPRGHGPPPSSQNQDEQIGGAATSGFSKIEWVRVAAHAAGAGGAGPRTSPAKGGT